MTAYQKMMNQIFVDDVSLQRAAEIIKAMYAKRANKKTGKQIHSKDNNSVKYDTLDSSFKE